MWRSRTNVLSLDYANFSLKQVDTVLRGINKKITDNIINHSPDDQWDRVAIKYPQAFFRSLEDNNLNTKKFAESILQSLREIFDGQNPSIYEMIINIGNSIPKSHFPL